MVPTPIVGNEILMINKLTNNLGNEFPLGVVNVLIQLGRRKDPLSLVPPQCLRPPLSGLSAEHLKTNSRHTLEFDRRP